MRAAASAGRARSSRPAARPMRRPAPTATRISARSRRCSRTRPRTRPSTRSISPPGSSGHGCRSRRSGRVSRRSSRRWPPPMTGCCAVATALRTTDSKTKVATTTVELPAADGKPVTVRVSGVAKGVGMIHPRMATMLSIVLTDATVAPEVLWGMLRPAAARTWDQLSVDGDTSTNDTVFLLASGASEAAPVGAGTTAAGVLGAAIEAIARDLARQQAADGEGASTLITAAVTGARDDADARAVARADRVVQPGQGRGPRSRPELGPDRRRGRQRPAGRCGRPGGGRPVRGGRDGPCRHPGRAGPRSAPDLDRRPPRVRRRRPAGRSPSIVRRPAPRWRRPR